MVKAATRAEDASLPDLQAEAEELRRKINRFRTSLGRFFVQKQEIIDLMVVAAIAQEPLLLVGPPGTAKSDLVLKFKDALGRRATRTTSSTCSRGSPSRRRSSAPSTSASCATARTSAASRASCRPPGSPSSTRSSSRTRAILNILLTIINEKKFYQDGMPEPVPLRVLFAATNEIPEQGELAALKDRFVLKIMSRSVSDEHFQELIDAGLQGEAYRNLNQKPWVEGHCTLDDLAEGQPLPDATCSAASRATAAARSRTTASLFFPDEVFREFQRLVKTLMREDRIFISDRKLVKLYKLFRVRAWLFSGGTVSLDDLRLLGLPGRNASRRSSTCARRCRPCSATPDPHRQDGLHCDPPRAPCKPIPGPRARNLSAGSAFFVATEPCNPRRRPVAAGSRVGYALPHDRRDPPAGRGRRRGPRAAAGLLPLVYDELRRLAADKLAREEPGPDPAADRPGPRGLPAAGRTATAAGTGTAAATSSPPPPRPCAASWSITPGARRARSAAAGRARVELREDALAAPEGPDEVLRRGRGPRPGWPPPTRRRPSWSSSATSPACRSTRPARALGISPRSADRLWALARAWLHRAVDGSQEDEHPGVVPARFRLRLPGGRRGRPCPRLATAGDVAAGGRRGMPPPSPAHDRASIFLAALDIADPAERAAYLDRACGGDAGLRGQVEDLLQGPPAARRFLEQPAPALVATVDEPPPGRVPRHGDRPVQAAGADRRGRVRRRLHGRADPARSAARSP